MRKEGESPRSTDAAAAAAYAGLAAAVALSGAGAAEALGERLASQLARPAEEAGLLLGAGGGAHFGQLLLDIGVASAPLLALPAAAVVVVLVAQQGVVLATKKVMPSLSRIDPISNAKQKYGPKGLVEFAKSALKLAAIMVVLAVALSAELPQLATHAHLSERLVAGLLAQQFWAVMAGVLISVTAIAFLDLVWQRASFLARARMSHQELREETRGAEGDPHMKQERRERARRIAQNRMLNDVPGADVVVTNPKHFAVALKWSRAGNRAPVCLAKGVDEVAFAIRRRAEAAGVPIHPDPPTARAIHGTVEIGREIRPEHYRAVAAAILFAEKLRAGVRRGWRDGA